MNIILSGVFLGHFDFTAKIIPPDKKLNTLKMTICMQSSIAPYPYNVSNGSRT